MKVVSVVRFTRMCKSYNCVFRPRILRQQSQQRYDVGDVRPELLICIRIPSLANQPQRAKVPGPKLLEDQKPEVRYIERVEHGELDGRREDDGRDQKGNEDRVIFTWLRAFAEVRFTDKKSQLDEVLHGISIKQKKVQDGRAPGHVNYGLDIAAIPYEGSTSSMRSKVSE